MARTPAYCTSLDVAYFLQRTADFSGTTVPNQATVNDIIVRCERYVEQRTGRAWTTVGNSAAYQSATPALDGYDVADYEYHDLGPPWSYYNYGLIHKPRFQLQHPDIVTPLDSTKGDSLQLSFGGDFVEMLPPTGSWVHKYLAGDYFIVSPQGWLVINSGYPLIRFPKGCRIKYRYGLPLVDPWVKDVTVKLSASEVLILLTKGITLSGGPGNPVTIDAQARIQSLVDECNKRLDEHSFYNYQERKPIII